MEFSMETRLVQESLYNFRKSTTLFSLDDLYCKVHVTLLSWKKKFIVVFYILGLWPERDSMER